MSATTNSLNQWTFGRRKSIRLILVPKKYGRPSRAKNTEGFKSLVHIAQDKVADKLHRERGKLKPANDWHYQPRYFREAAT